MKSINCVVEGSASCSFQLQVEKWRAGGCIRCGLERIRYARFLCWTCFDVTHDEDISYIVNRYGLEDYAVSK